VICPRCERQTVLRLHDIPGLLRELETALSRQTTRIEASFGSSCPPGCEHRLDDPGCAAGVRLELNPAAGQVASDLLGGISGVACRLADEITTVNGPRVRSVTLLLSSPAGQAALLAGARGLAARPWSDDLARRLLDVTRAAWRVIDLPPDQAFVGWCPIPCRAALYARPGHEICVCRRCGSRWDVERSRAQLLERIADQELTAVQIERALGIPASTVRWWKKEGKLLPSSMNAAGQPLYLVGDVRRLADARAPVVVPAQTPPSGLTLAST
jgi:hypothetical protein